MPRALWYVLVTAFLLSPIEPAFAQDEGVFGYWKTIDDETGKPQAVIRLWEYQGKLVGRIVKLFPKPGEEANPVCDECSGSLHNKPVIGMTFLWGFVRDQGNDRKWTNGEIVDPDSGDQYHCQLELTDGGKKLEVFGYIRLLVKVGRTEVWLRASPEDLQS
jgi:uncharacterized protein (DUF2147 family)